VEDLSPELTSWTKTAAAMAELDLIIGVDTAVTNLAGGLGRPVWLCLSASPGWRWMLERRDTPWYPSARLFRQLEAGNWATVFQEIARELRHLVAVRHGDSGIQPRLVISPNETPSIAPP
jgi:hypothetical protein